MTGAPSRVAARRDAYRLLAELYREGVTARTAELIAGVPILEEVAPTPSDATASDHEKLFARTVFPRAGAFLHPEGLVGPAPGPVAEVRRTLGLAPAGDHVSDLLDTLAQVDEALAGALLDDHALWWLPAFSRAVAREGGAFWGRVADLTLDLVVDHRSSLGAHDIRWGPPPPDPPDLTDVGTGLGTIVRFLVSHARSGLFLTAEDARRFGRATGLPGGFGRREDVLAGLLRSAVEFGKLDDAWDWLHGLVDGAKRAHELLRPRAGLDRPGAVWVRRLETTSALLSAAASEA